MKTRVNGRQNEYAMIPPMPLRPERVPGVLTVYWTADDWQRWQVAQRERQRAVDEWDAKYRHAHSVQMARELAANALAKGDYDKWATYERVADVLEGGQNHERD